MSNYLITLQDQTEFEIELSSDELHGLLKNLQNDDFIIITKKETIICIFNKKLFSHIIKKS